MLRKWKMDELIKDFSVWTDPFAASEDEGNETNYTHISVACKGHKH